MYKKFSLLILLQVVFNVSGQEKWRFINILDYHKSEGLSIQDDEIRQQRIEEQKKGFVEMYKTNEGELITIPVDIVGGHWHRSKFVKKLTSVPKFANYTTSQVVSEVCKRSYKGLSQLVYEFGYKNLLIAVGDYELGDNPWRNKNGVVKYIKKFREGFADVFTLDDKGKSRFTKNIGNALPRPIGTKYEHTSNAYQNKNLLFVTLDMFRFDSKDKIIGSQGVITRDISGKHFNWLESVLKKAQNIQSIKHIVVQSHLPIIYPVRKYASSGMMVDDRESEKILNLFRKYNVDLYLAGEVHMNTVTKDSKSNLIQFVARGNDLSNLTTIDVENEKLSLTTYHKNGDILGNLTIDKKENNTHIKGDGLLKPINPKGIQIHWGFDQIIPKKKYKSSVTGTFPEQSKHNPLLKGMSKSQVLINDGDFMKVFVLILLKVQSYKCLF